MQSPPNGTETQEEKDCLGLDLRVFPDLPLLVGHLAG